jgi:nucleoid-associated protein YgaU
MKRASIAVLLAAALAIPGIQAVGALQERPPETIAYVIRAGDTLWAIAGRVDPDRDPRAVVEQLMELNGLQSPTLLPGQTLRLPA